MPQTGAAQGRLMDQLQRQARFHSFGSLRRPAADQVPDSQPQQFGDQQPDAGQVAHDLVGEALSHPVLEAAGIARDGLGAPSRDLNRDGRLSVGAVAMEFFFEDRTSR